MEQIVGGIIVMCLGIALILFRQKFIDRGVDLNNNEGFGFYKYGGRERKIMRISVPLFGLFVTVLGLLIVANIFDLK